MVLIYFNSTTPIYKRFHHGSNIEGVLYVGVSETKHGQARSVRHSDGQLTDKRTDRKANMQTDS